MVVAFTEIFSTGTPSNSASLARMAGACGVIFGRSQISVISALENTPPRSLDAFGGVAQEAGAVGVLPGVFAGREMPADIAFRQRAIDGVAKRVDADIGIGMAGEAFFERDFDAADDHFAVFGHGMHVETGADSGDHACS